MSNYSTYSPIADAAASQYGIPQDLFEAQIGQESSWNPNASNGSAYGIAQFIPSTANSMGVDSGDPTSSIYGAAQYDASLYQNSGSWVQALTSYGTLSSTDGNLSTGQQNVMGLASAYDMGSGISASMVPASGASSSTPWYLMGAENPDGTPNTTDDGTGGSITSALNQGGISSAVSSIASDLNPNTWITAIEGFLGRGVFVIVGILILIVAIFMLGNKKQNINISDVLPAADMLAA